MIIGVSIPNVRHCYLSIYPYKGFGNHPELVIKPEDADFVDIVHTASDNMSFLEPLGHADFYPNGGQNQVFEEYLVDIIDRKLSTVPQSFIAAV